MNENIVRFIADKIAIKPPTADGSIKVEFSTGTYSIPKLQLAYMWQATVDRAYEVFIRPLSDTMPIPVTKREEGEGVEEQVAEETNDNS